jgi:hypothetical protein
MAQMRVTHSSATKFCAQCSFFGGNREKQGSYLLYDTNTTGKCCQKPATPFGGKEVKAQHTCSSFERWNIF